MCLAIPGQLVEWADRGHQMAVADIAGVRRAVNVGLLTGEDEVDIGDWVLIHVGFAMSKVDEEEAEATRNFLELLGAPYQNELEELRGSAVE
jgi:hydrogenase expression/formation protein HypC